MSTLHDVHARAARLIQEGLPNIWHDLPFPSGGLLIAACIADILADAVHQGRWEEDHTGLEWAVATGTDLQALLDCDDCTLRALICKVLKAMRCEIPVPLAPLSLPSPACPFHVCAGGISVVATCMLGQSRDDLATSRLPTISHSLQPTPVQKAILPPRFLGYNTAELGRTVLGSFTWKLSELGVSNMFECDCESLGDNLRL